MDGDISVLLYGVLSRVVDVYPVLADVEDAKELPLPYAVYRVKTSEERTKEGARERHEVTVAGVTGGYEEGWKLLQRMGDAVGELEGRGYLVRGVTGEVGYDAEERCYVGEMSLTIKKL